MAKWSEKKRTSAITVWCTEDEKTAWKTAFGRMNLSETVRRALNSLLPSAAPESRGRGSEGSSSS